MFQYKKYNKNRSICHCNEVNLMTDWDVTDKPAQICT